MNTKQTVERIDQLRTQAQNAQQVASNAGEMRDALGVFAAQKVAEECWAEIDQLRKTPSTLFQKILRSRKFREEWDRENKS